MADALHRINDIWTITAIEPDTCYHWYLGSLDLWVQNINDEWRVAAEIGAEADARDELICGSTGDAPDELEWERHIMETGSNHLQLKPLMPDRPVVVRPETRMYIAPGQEIRIYVSIPLWVQLLIGEQKELVICEKPTGIFSNTWFGTPVQGELCYALNTQARRNLDDFAIKPFRALCPVHIHNSHNEDLLFERLCIRTGALSIYGNNDRLITNKLSVNYQGGEQLSKVKYGKKAPAELEKAQLLSEPRTQPDNLIKMSFSSIMAHTIHG